MFIHIDVCCRCTNVSVQVYVYTSKHMCTHMCDVCTHLHMFIHVYVYCRCTDVCTHVCDMCTHVQLQRLANW